MNKKIITAALMLLFAVAIKAQTVDVPTSNTQTTSPYSRYGYGVLSNKSIGASKGMGGISYGVKGQNVNPYNPASYSNVDSLTFIFDIGVSYTNTKLSEPGASQRDDNGGLDFLLFQFPLSKKIGMSFGFLRYADVGYSFGSIKNISGVDYQESHSGSGGLSQIYGGLAYSPLKGLSVGANIAYLYGDITRGSSIPQFSNSSIYTSYQERLLTINAAKFDFGLQYEFPILNNKKNLTIGLVYSPQINPSARLEEINKIVNTGDTVSMLSRRTVDAKFPHTFGVGFSVSGKNLLFGADVTYEKWKNLDYPIEEGDGLSSSDRFNDRWIVNAGMQYVINPNDRNYFKKIRFRAGLNYSNSYLNVRNSSDGRIGGYNEYGATIGFGLPIKDSYTGRTSFINIGLEYSKLSPEFSSMIKQEFIGVSLNLNLNDFWFMKNKFK